ncbi:SET domain-containing protein SmydA-8 isoform X1 [Drosophila ficusphila]|uniref:SET domain-containing protein SmydA-8 isoform X1 n=1 Tax=Drosophila ficusphila TaxID=30025 RepID=UPI0007E82688|nr:SET domain-containing protein SmydA-8 isoform X1 [Drosophila ficusphila]
MTSNPTLSVNRTSVEWSPLCGRFLVAKSATPGREILTEELPFALGPKCNGPVVCLGCYEPDPDPEEEHCLECGWPLCEDCSRNEDNHHSKMECSVLSDARARFFPLPIGSSHCPQLDCILPLRVLLAKEEDPERWDSKVAPMEHHEEERKKDADLWHADRVNIAQYLRGPCKLASRFSEELIMQVVGILEVNAFEARSSKGYPLRCLFPYTGILAHNCVPNTCRSIYPSEGYKIRLRAMVDLEEGQPLHHSYTYTLDGTSQRQNHLKQGKFFSCKCDRCLDPTELGTHFSSLKCGQCAEGFQVPREPTETDTSWICSSCGATTSNTEAQKMLQSLQAEVNAVQSLENGAKRLEEVERLLRKYKSLLHPLHYIATGLRQLLIEMYGRVKGYEMVQLPDQKLERKAELCRQVLRVLNTFEPGLSRTRAMNLYELHVPLVLLAKSGFIAGKLKGGELRARLVDAIDLLTECVEILEFEDKSSQEGVLCGVAKQALQQLTLSVEGLGSELD